MSLTLGCLNPKGYYMRAYIPHLESLPSRDVPSTVIMAYDQTENAWADGILTFSVLPARSENSEDRVDAVALFAKYADDVYPNVKVRPWSGPTSSEVVIKVTDLPTHKILGSKLLDNVFGHNINAFRILGKTEDVTPTDHFLTEGFARSVIETVDPAPFHIYRNTGNPPYASGTEITFKIAHTIDNLNLRDQQIILDRILGQWQALLPTLRLRQVYNNDFATVLINPTLDQINVTDEFSSAFDIKNVYAEIFAEFKSVAVAYSVLALLPVHNYTGLQQIEAYPYQIYIVLNPYHRDWYIDLTIGDTGGSGGNETIDASWTNIIGHEIGHSLGFYDLYLSNIEFAKMGFWTWQHTWIDKLAADLYFYWIE